MFAHISVLHLSGQCALARMAKTLSFHIILFLFRMKVGRVARGTRAHLLRRPFKTP
jgi:hypothetical protein